MGARVTVTALHRKHVAFLSYQTMGCALGNVLIHVMQAKFAAPTVFVVTAALAVKTKKSVYMAHALRHAKVILTVTELPNYRV